MQKILKIAQREFVETAKTKTFILGLVMGPLIIAAIIFFTSLTSRSKKSPRRTVTVAVTDFSGKVCDEAEKASFREYNKENPERQIQIHQFPAAADPNATQEKAKEQLRRGRFDAYVVLDEGILQNQGGIRVYTYKPKPSELDVMGAVEYLFREAVRNLRYKAQNLSPELLDKLRSVEVTRIDVGADGRVETQADTGAMFMLPFAFMFLVYIGMVGTGQHLISSVIEEKGSRIIEVLLSAVSPFQLMAGKIVGLAGVGLTIIGVWVAVAYAAATWHGVTIDITAELILYLAVYYILGFLLFSSFFAGAGSICNTIKETQGLMMPIMMVVIVPMISWYKLVQDPDGTLARTLSFVPPLTSMVMVLRISAGSDVWIGEIIASIALLAATVVFAMWAAAKVFRTGILMYGKKPALREVLRWLTNR
jgi:ABC-2 type transport system permease protein